MSFVLRPIMFLAVYIGPRPNFFHSISSRARSAARQAHLQNVIQLEKLPSRTHGQAPRAHAGAYKYRLRLLKREGGMSKSLPCALARENCHCQKFPKVRVRRSVGVSRMFATHVELTLPEEPIFELVGTSQLPAEFVLDSIPDDISSLDKIYMVESYVRDKWLRGRVGQGIEETSEGTNNESTYEVYFIDHGFIEEEMTIDRFRSINEADSKRLGNLPPAVLRCSLSEIAPINNIWDDETIDVFKQMVQGYQETPQLSIELLKRLIIYHHGREDEASLQLDQEEILDISSSKVNGVNDSNNENDADVFIGSEVAPLGILPVGIPAIKRAVLPAIPDAAAEFKVVEAGTGVATKNLFKIY
ncbi:unnamed protein product [Trichogramma brassicae]|uniref:Tudor domain-containing protein n=1 Tax=Trichogramma brassicae TaxID=86971 RepID=A0A6H5IN61_9HYME|nr:unnamed protein product [Trichogramma brassicae]